MADFFKKFMCKHAEVRMLPKIEMVLREPESYREVGVFNQVSFQCLSCEKQGDLTLPVILTTKISGNLINRIIEDSIASKLGARSVKIV